MSLSSSLYLKLHVSYKHCRTTVRAVNLTGYSYKIFSHLCWRDDYDKPVRCLSVSRSTQCQHFQNLTAPAPLGQRRWHLACIFYESRDTTFIKHNFEFLRMCPRAWPRPQWPNWCDVRKFSKPYSSGTAGPVSTALGMCILWVWGHNCRSKLLNFRACNTWHCPQITPANFTHTVYMHSS